MENGTPQVAQAPAVPRDEAAIKRKMIAAVGVADETLIALWHALQQHKTAEKKITSGDAIDLQAAISVARGQIAEWRPESD